jgi:hypothetical protein
MGGSPQPLSNQAFLDGITAQAEQLRSRGAPSARDALARLMVGEYVFLPLDGLPRREDRPSSTAAFHAHRSAAVDEGARRRRHYLSLQIPGEAQDCVVTVFVRVHTAGGMLMVEYLPHVLRPVRPAFRAVDRIITARQGLPTAGWWLHTPAFAACSVSQLLRHGASWYRGWSADRRRESPEGPHASVRELAAEERAPLLPELDAHRHLQAVRACVVRGVTNVLHEFGYATAGFEEQIAKVSGGGAFIGKPSESSVGMGERSPLRPPSAGPRSPGPTTNPDDDSWR